jgi:magnesium transporter
MQIYTLESGYARLHQGDAVPTGVAWIDCTHDEVNADPQAWRKQMERLAGYQIFDLHVADCVNLQHPSHFDSMHDYDMLVFRKLSMPTGEADAPATGKRKQTAGFALTNIQTRPMTFFCGERVLITVRSASSRVLEGFCARLMEPPRRPNDGNGTQRITRPEEVMLRILNILVDSYLDLRAPLAQQLDSWQRELLDPSRPFHDWSSLLEARIEIRKLEQLSEEQYDALQEFRDSLIDSSVIDQRDMLLVRTNDVLEHVLRVVNHARRLESSAESAVQLHFSAMSHRTNQIVRTLTVITAVFAPLTLITGLFGMNFEHMPLLKDKEGFWWTLGAMACVAALSLAWFRAKRYISESAFRRSTRARSLE